MRRPRRRGLPTGIRWKTCADTPAAQKRRGVQCRRGATPATFADRLTLEGDPTGLIGGTPSPRARCRRDAATCYIRSEYPRAFRVFSEAIDRAAPPAGSVRTWLAAGRAFHLEARLGAGAYICGEETSLLESSGEQRAARCA